MDNQELKFLIIKIKNFVNMSNNKLDIDGEKVNKLEDWSEKKIKPKHGELKLENTEST
jgi:hypothetical protein